MTNIQPGLARISWELPETDLNETIALLGSVGLGQGVNIEYGSDLSGELNKRYSPDLVMVVKDPNTAEDISIVTVDHLKKFAEPNDFPMSVATRLGGALIRKYRREFKSNSRVAEDLSHYVFIDNYDHRAGIIADRPGLPGPIQFLDVQLAGEDNRDRLASVPVKGTVEVWLPFREKIEAPSFCIAAHNRSSRCHRVGWV